MDSLAMEGGLGDLWDRVTWEDRLGQWEQGWCFPGTARRQAGRLGGQNSSLKSILCVCYHEEAKSLQPGRGPDLEPPVDALREVPFVP